MGRNLFNDRAPNTVPDSTNNFPPEPAKPSLPVSETEKPNPLLLFLSSFLALYFELVIIRYLATEVRVFAYLKNLALIASFLGIGLGMILGRPPKVLKRAFPFLVAAIFILIAYASPLNLRHLPFPNLDYYVWGEFQNAGLPAIVLMLRYLCGVLGILILVVGFFVVLGGLVGEHLARLPSLRGYGINLAGSLTGIAAFTAVSSFGLPPVVWLLLGFLAALPFFLRQRLAIITFALVILATGIPRRDVFWSPYYCIALKNFPPPPGWPRPSLYELSVDYDYHQVMVDLSSAFLRRYPDEKTYHIALSNYELPYQLVTNPGEVLVVGAGPGNDVAAALRHGATHVDAVEIDPVILEIGRRLHPERPYDSPRVTLYVDDARAFFKKTKKSYDLIVFGFLDSLTLLTSFSSVRLDNYVYTVGSFREAKSLLRKDGSQILSFASGRTFVTERLFATLSQAFDIAPRVYYTAYLSNGVVFVEGKARDAPILKDYPEISEQLRVRESAIFPATDRWPFLYLAKRSIPLSIIAVLIPFIYASILLVHRTVTLPRIAERENLHLFLLGAGFLLLETKGVTELSLLFGSTWLVNSVVIGAFLTMALLANTLVMVRPASRGLAYVGLFALLGVGLIFPYSLLHALPAAEKVLAAGTLVGLPVFFSGLIFSRSFRDVTQPSQALGVNLLGAVIGGALENVVMIAGIPILGVLAIFLYAFSAVSIPRKIPYKSLPSRAPAVTIQT